MEEILQNCRTYWTVSCVLKDMVHSIELCDVQNGYIAAINCKQSCENLADSLHTRLLKSEMESKTLRRYIVDQKDRATQLREEFVNEVGKYLHACKKIVKADSKLAEEVRIVDRVGKSIVEDVAAIPLPHNMGINSVNTEISLPIHNPPTIVKKPKLRRKGPFNIFLRLSESILLEIFPFLETVEVLNAAQVNRAVFARVDALFGIDSAIVKRPEWEKESIELKLMLERGEEFELVGDDDHVQPTAATGSFSVSLSSSSNKSSSTITSSAVMSPTAAAVPSSPMPLGLPDPSLSSSSSGGGVKLSREMVDALTKKLSPTELKFVLSLSEQLKRRQQAVEALETDKLRLQDSLKSAESEAALFYEKLKDAELALKRQMQEGASQRQQAAADQEVISYLDLTVQELTKDKQEAQLRCQFLQASLELQGSVRAESEQRLLAQLAEERQRCEQLEKDARRQRTVLAKEVKALRSQLGATQADAARMAGKLDTLRTLL